MQSKTAQPWVLSGNVSQTGQIGWLALKYLTHAGAQIKMVKAELVGQPTATRLCPHMARSMLFVKDQDCVAATGTEEQVRQEYTAADV